MSWLEALIRTYDNCTSAIGDYDQYKKPLAPIYHMVVNSYLTIRLDMDGNFLGCDIENEGNNESVTIIPVTESSAGRSGKDPTPHPLCDQIKYIAGDYWKYSEPEKAKNNFNNYKSGLEKWYNSQYCTDKIKAIYKYISKENMISDLISCGIFTVDKNGNYKIEDSKYIRFKVICPEKTEYISETWKDKELFDKFIDFNESLMEKRALCFDTGMEQFVSRNHPKKIINAAANAKLISSNAKWNEFVWSGRFRNSSEAAEVSYEGSQKAHNALSWLIENQGYKKDCSAIVSWCVENKEIPNTANIIIGNSFDSKIDEEVKIETEYEYSQLLNRALRGYQSKIEPNDRVVIMAVEAVTKNSGRLSIKHYGELMASDYFNNLEDWYNKCSWINLKGNVYSPSPREICKTAYGIMRNGKLIVDNEKIENKCVDRLFPCITEGRTFPKDIMMAAVRNVSRAESFIIKRDNKYHKILIANTCAIIKAYCKDKGVEITMELNSSNDRSYLFGRLLAVAEALERSTYQGEKRVTNAERYWSSFAQRPASTWATIQGRLRPYVNRAEYRSRYEKLFEEIHSKFVSPDDYIENKELSPMYILGYWCQKNELYKSKNNTEATNDEEE